jgi:hypothetical protein
MKPELNPSAKNVVFIYHCAVATLNKVKCALFENNHEERLIVLGASLWFEGGTF